MLSVLLYYYRLQLGWVCVSSPPVYSCKVVYSVPDVERGSCSALGADWGLCSVLNAGEVLCPTLGVEKVLFPVLVFEKVLCLLLGAGKRSCLLLVAGRTSYLRLGAGKNFFPVLSAEIADYLRLDVEKMSCLLLDAGKTTCLGVEMSAYLLPAAGIVRLLVLNAGRTLYPRLRVEMVPGRHLGAGKMPFLLLSVGKAPSLPLDTGRALKDLLGAGRALCLALDVVVGDDHVVPCLTCDILDGLLVCGWVLIRGHAYCDDLSTLENK